MDNTTQKLTNPPINLKRIFIVALGISTGVGFVVATLIGISYWYLSRPEQPKPWDTTTIVATYDGLLTEGADNSFVFYYVLENKGARDYRLEGGKSVSLLARLARQRSLSSDADYLTIDLPIFIPAGHRHRVEIHLKYSFTEPYPSNGTDEDKKRYKLKLEKFLNEEASNLDGFVLFDEVNHHEIRFQKGW
jgi:hypothetical protein